MFLISFTKKFIKKRLFRMNKNCTFATNFYLELFLIKTTDE